MLDTIVYIPTILAYAFIGLLFVILSFIVIYVGHKIYNSIYDSLPLNSLVAMPTVLDKDELEDEQQQQQQQQEQYQQQLQYQRQKRKATQQQQHIQELQFKSANETFVGRPSTVRRPSRIQSIDVKRSSSFSRKAAKTALRIIVTLEPCYLAYVVFETNAHALQRRKVVRYYDRLSSIPYGRAMKRCSMESRLDLPASSMDKPSFTSSQWEP